LDTDAHTPRFTYACARAQRLKLKFMAMFTVFFDGLNSGDKRAEVTMRE